MEGEEEETENKKGLQGKDNIVTGRGFSIPSSLALSLSLSRFYFSFSSARSLSLRVRVSRIRW